MASLVALVQNIALLLAGALLFDLMAGSRGTGGKTRHLFQVFLGFGLGALGIVVMMTPWTFTTGLVFDTRSVLIAVSGLFFGTIPTVVAMVMTVCFRLSQGGIGTLTGVSVILASGIIGIVWRHRRGHVLDHMGWLELFLFGLVVHLVMLALMFTLPWSMAVSVVTRISLPVLMIYPLGTALFGRLIVKRLQTERTRADLAESEKRYRVLVETAKEGIWTMDASHRTSFVNKSMADMLGYTQADMLGRPVEDFFFPEDMEFHAQRMQVRHAGTDEVYERRFRHHDGSQLWTLASAKALKDDEGRFSGSFAMFTDITRRKQTEDALNKSETMLRTVLNTIPDLIWLKDPQGVYLTCNETFERFFGAKRDAIVGKTDYDFVDKQLADFFRQNDQLAIEADCPRKNEETLTFHDDLYTGQFETLKAPMKDSSGKLLGVLGIARDVTESRRIQDQLRLSERDLKAVLNNLPSMIGYWDKSLHCRLANRAYLDWFGIDQEQMVGLHAQDLLGEDDLKTMLPYIDGVLAGDPQLFERSISSPAGGPPRYALVHYIPDIADDDVQGFYALVTDITSIKETELALEASLKEKEVLLKEIHHRVKNNLQIISSLLNLQEEGIHHPAALDALTVCRGRVNAMAAIHEQLYQERNLASIDAASYLKQFLPRLIAAYKGEKNISLTFNVSSVSLLVDQAIPFGLIVNELVTNAMKHAFRGRESGTLEVSVSQANGTATLVVMDNGVGIPESVTLQTASTLGLQIITMLARQLKGEVAVESDGGTCVRLQFPLRHG
ncbi:MAG: PAS domain S-box protein [Desulfovibrio sp.]|nr:PAS domain S-box protein [Desulfovibrio sp.]